MPHLASLSVPFPCFLSLSEPQCTWFVQASTANSSEKYYNTLEHQESRWSRNGAIRSDVTGRRRSWRLHGGGSYSHLTNFRTRHVGVSDCRKPKSTRLKQPPVAQRSYQISWKSDQPFWSFRQNVSSWNSRLVAAGSQLKSLTDEWTKHAQKELLIHDGACRTPKAKIWKGAVSNKCEVESLLLQLINLSP
jgi:hypothetical protein